MINRAINYEINISYELHLNDLSFKQSNNQKKCLGKNAFHSFVKRILTSKELSSSYVTNMTLGLIKQSSIILIALSSPSNYYVL